MCRGKGWAVSLPAHPLLTSMLEAMENARGWMGGMRSKRKENGTEARVEGKSQSTYWRKVKYLTIDAHTAPTCTHTHTYTQTHTHACCIHTSTHISTHTHTNTHIHTHKHTHTTAPPQPPQGLSFVVCCSRNKGPPVYQKEIMNGHTSLLFSHAGQDP